MKKSINIVHVVGARPNIIKIASILRACKKIPEIKSILVHAGKHYTENISKTFFEEFGHLLVAYDAKDLPEGIRKLKNFTPRERKVNPKPIADRIFRFLNSLQD